VDLQLVSTWFEPAARTVVMFAGIIVDLLLEEWRTPGKALVPIAMFHAFLFVDRLETKHKYIAETIRYTGYLLLYWIVYFDLWRSAPWPFEQTGWWVFGASAGLLVLLVMAESRINALVDAHQHAPVVLASLLAVVPNAANTIHESVFWEMSFRSGLFVFSAWFCLIVNVMSATSQKPTSFFLQFGWVLFVHRYLTPFVGILWMREILKLSRFFSVRVHESCVGEEESTDVDAGEEFMVQQERPPTLLFRPSEVPSGSASQPSRRRMLKKWQPVCTKRQQTIMNLSPQDQLLKLQQLSNGVDAV